MDYLKARERHLLFVLGKGFDPRMCLGLRTLLGAGGSGKRDVLAIDLREGESSPSRALAPMVDANWTDLENVGGKTALSTKPIDMRSAEGRAIGSRRAAGIFRNGRDLMGYTDVVIDVSALPRSIYFPLIAKVLNILDQAPEAEFKLLPNVHVLVAENPEVDRRIRDEGVEDTAVYVYPFSARVDMESTAEYPKIWLPLLGEAQEAQLERIYDLVKPDEISPVLPSPSVNPRRGDDLVYEYRYLLFDRLRVEARDLIYASEWNPFEVYRRLLRAIIRYREALMPLGGCKAVISALSTKLTSIGALLAAYELRQLKEQSLDVGVAHVESQGYAISQADRKALPLASTKLFELWLRGECYES